MNVERGRVLNPSRRWLSSERVAIRVLEDLGYSIQDVRKKIVVNDTVVGEVDAIVSDGVGQVFAVEIKSGKIDVSGIRQAYVNSVILGVKPLVVCKGFADDAAKELAERLGVKVIQLSDIFLVESEELETLLREVLEDTVAEYFEALHGAGYSIGATHLEVLRAIAETTAIDEAAEKLGIDVHTLTKRIDEMRSAGILPRWARRYSTLKRIARLYTQRQNIIRIVDDVARLYELLKSIEQQLNQIAQLLSTTQKHASKIQTPPQQSST